MCKTAASLITSADCQIYAQSAPLLGEFNDKTGYIKFKDSENAKFGAVLHQDHDYMGRCRVCLADGCDINYVSGVSSVTVFAKADSGEGSGATFYEMDNFGGKGWSAGPIAYAYPYKNSADLGLPQEKSKQIYWGRSIKIENEGKYLVVLYESYDRANRCEVFAKSDPSLDANYIGECGAFGQYGCFSSATILPIKSKF